MFILLINIIVILLTLFYTITHLIYFGCKVIYNMDPADAKYLRTERKPSTIDVHPQLNAIMLNYEIDVQIIGRNDEIIYSEKKQMQKIIELPMLNSRTDCNAMAREVVYQCDLIHHSRLAEVEQTIFYLKKRKLSHAHNKDLALNQTNGVSEEPKFSNLAEYIELLYEGMGEKIKGALCIQTLARDPANLEALSKNETVISALGRVLREDWKRSIVLTTHLIHAFFFFSMYKKFHDIIIKCKVGSICMDIIDYELRRYYKWRADLEGTEPPQDTPIIKKPCPSSASMTEIHRSRIPEPVRPRSGNFTDTNIKAIMEGSIYDDLTNSTESISDKRLTDAEKAKRFRTLVKKQNQILRVSFYLLLNISEDEPTEEKMSKRNIVGLLVRALDRDNEELLVIVVTFLKKLTIMSSNKENMMSLNIVEKFPKLLDSNSVDLVHTSLKMMFNLAFDEKIRFKMVQVGMIPRLVRILSDEQHQNVVLRLLYQISSDNEFRGIFVDTAGLIVDMLLLNVGNAGDEVMIALSINLAVNASNAQQMVKKNRLQSLMVRAFTYENQNIMKMLHNISEHPWTRTQFIEFVGDLSRAVVDSKNEDFTRECIGILSNLDLAELDWAEIFKHFKMTSWIENTLKNNSSDVELILRVLVLLGTAAGDKNCSKLLCRTNIIKNVIDLLKTHQEDDEIVLQILYIFYVSLRHERSREYLTEKTEAAGYLIDLLQDDNKQIRDICNICLNIISDYSQSWGERIKIEKFRHHNAQWLQMVDSHQLLEPEEEDDDVLPPYLNTEYLSTAVVSKLSDANEPEDNSESERIANQDLEDFEAFKSEIMQDFEIESM